jgi:Flp pilus assembly protein TadG
MKRRATALRCADGGAAAVEFAVSLPMMLILGLVGAEVANMTSANLAVSQIALSVADNASRLGQTDNSGVTPTVTEADVDAVLYGALQQGAPLGIATRGRIILSSLERDPVTGKQYIHWQRCRGSLVRNSAYGNDSTLNGLVGPAITGLGAGTQKAVARAGSAVMFAEVFYEFRGALGSYYLGTITMKREAAFVVRDDRNLTPGLTGGGSQSACS